MEPHGSPWGPRGPHRAPCTGPHGAPHGPTGPHEAPQGPMCLLRGPMGPYMEPHRAPGIGPMEFLHWALIPWGSWARYICWAQMLGRVGTRWVEGVGCICRPCALLGWWVPQVTFAVRDARSAPVLDPWCPQPCYFFFRFFCRGGPK